MSKPITAPDAAKKAARKDKRIVQIRVFPDGWLPNSYNWPAAGRRFIFERNGARQWRLARVEGIDRKRAHGEGPEWTAVSERGGTLASA